MANLTSDFINQQDSQLGTRLENMREFLGLLLFAALASGCSEPAPRPFSSKVYLEVYNIQDLTVGGGSMGQCWGDRPDEEVPEGFVGCYQFAVNARRAIAPEQWGMDKWDLLAQNGLLIVRAPEYIHNAVVSYLATLRAKGCTDGVIQDDK